MSLRIYLGGHGYVAKSIVIVLQIILDIHKEVIIETSSFIMIKLEFKADFQSSSKPVLLVKLSTSSLLSHSNQYNIRAVQDSAY